MDLAKIDKNFEVKTNINKDDIVFYNADELPFRVYGVFKENGKYRRMPEEVAKRVNEGVNVLHTHTTGGRVRFVTDSEYVAIYAKISGVEARAHFAMTGLTGFDLYVGNAYENTFIPPFDMSNGFEGIREFGNREMREITINFPLYSNVEELYIGLQEDAEVKEGKPYVNEKPIVYYGSSITQGGCASRPGMSYQNIVSRVLNCDFVNLGFSGSARAEDAMIEYIKNLDMSVFVCDYDHNAPSTEHLEKTHQKMFKTVREAHPHIPVIIMPRPKHRLDEDEEARFAIIKKTYEEAKALGDKNVYLIDGKMLTELCGDEGTVDGIHPTDLGFVSIAKALCNCMESIIEGKDKTHERI